MLTAYQDLDERKLEFETVTALEKARRERLWAAIATVCPPLALPPTDVTVAQLLDLPHRWHAVLEPLYHKYPAHSSANDIALMPTFDAQHDLVTLILFGNRKVPNGLNITKQEREAIGAVQTMCAFCVKWGRLLRGRDGVVTDRPPALSVSHPLRSCESKYNSPHAELDRSAKTMDMELPQGPSARHRESAMVSTDVVNPQRDALMTPHYTDGAGMAGAHAGKEPKDNDCLHFYQDIMAAAMF
jgi:hypothetical protein